ncbi:MAG: c-type cytochrome, partial [Verrucomicrobiota bacterium]|nr:c-type cytochrome [Verrucomicrobiota bacterium]
LRKIPRLDKMTTQELVTALDSPNGWQRDTAQRLLVHAQDKNTVEPLRKLIASSKREKTRMQALCALDGINALDFKTLITALKDSHPLVRANAIRVSEKIIPGILHEPSKENSEIIAAVLNLTDDLEIGVRYQLAFSLGELNDFRAAEALAKIALKDWNNSEMQIAILSSAPKHVGQMLTAILAQTKAPPVSLMEQLLSLATALGDEKLYAKTLVEISQSANGKFKPWQFAALAGFLDALERGNNSLKMLREKSDDNLKKTIDQLEPLFAQARELANPQFTSQRSGEISLESAISAVRILGRGLSGQKNDFKLLGELLQPQIAPALQKAALADLQRAKEKSVATILLARWNSYGPELRAEVLNAIFNRPEWIELLLAEIETGNIPAGQIGAAAQQTLLKHASEKIRERAAQLFSAESDRQKIVKQYQIVADLKGDIEKGRVLFQKNCAVCHRFKSEGNQIGPDLGMMADKSVLDFLTAIFNPNQAVEARYVNYSAITKSEREISGIISAETPASITLKTIGGAEETILRRDLKELKSSGLSLMPEGFENALLSQDAADLIAFLKAK